MDEMAEVRALTFEWSKAAIDAAAGAVCALASGELACRCGGGCRRVAQRVLAAALAAERESIRMAGNGKSQ